MNSILQISMLFNSVSLLSSFELQFSQTAEIATWRGNTETTRKGSIYKGLND